MGLELRKRRWMRMFDHEELTTLEELLNEEILGCLRSGYSLNEDYIVRMRGMLKKLGLKELYTFERWRDDE